MRTSRARLEDAKFETERRRQHRGTARISLDILKFQLEAHEQLNRENVERLKGIYRREGYRPQFINNRILVEIDETCFEAALTLSGVAATELLTSQREAYPELRLPAGTEITCLHGKHRIQAAREFLSPRDKWWIADVYLANELPELHGGFNGLMYRPGLSTDMKRCLVEEYANESIPTDGMIYYKIRQYHFQRNFSFESRWWARLRGCRSRNLKALFKHPDLTAAFDVLLDVPGLWGGMLLTTLHKVLGLKSDDEILNYLEHIRRFWHDLVDGDPSAMQRFDHRDVKALELRAPGISTYDTEEIRAQICAGRIMGAFSEEERRYIFQRLSGFKYLIPSLYTLFRDITYWEACVGSVRHLMTMSRRDTISSVFESRFSATNQHNDRVVIQIDLGFRQIIAFAMRHFVEIPREPISDDVTVRPRVKANRATLRQFAELAIRVGFESPEVRRLLDTEELLGSSIAPELSRPLLVTSGPGEKLHRRCGLPNLDTFQDDKNFLFLHHLHNQQDKGGEGITGFFVLRCLYFAFMGPSDLLDGLLSQAWDHLVASHAREEQAREEQARREHERREDERREYERYEHEQREQHEQERREQREQARQEQEQRLEKAEEQASREQKHIVPKESPELVSIHFKARENSIWRDVQSISVNRSDPSHVVRVAKKYIRKGVRILDTNMHLLTPDNCFEAVTTDGTNTIVLVPQRELDIDEQALDSARVLAIVEESSKRLRK
ncbi:hypothetical protein PV11_03480 [Exophiala sideris]|uniref:Uncharacterized protein n=1 Tax=Exophiala sideris TaxID=1016849 RepID=A0A0D1Z310_9EURO|nr:hypothetical protein PV11_03480 [Exophiala sideris]